MRRNRNTSDKGRLAPSLTPDGYLDMARIPLDAQHLVAESGMIPRNEE